MLRPSLALVFAGVAWGSAVFAEETPRASAEYRTVNDWGVGIVGEFSLVNQGPADVQDWSLSFDLPAEIPNLWGGHVISHEGKRYRIEPESWSRHIGPGGRITLGFQAAPGGAPPGNVTFGVRGTTAPAPSPPVGPTPASSASPAPTAAPFAPPVLPRSPTPNPSPGPSGLSVRSGSVQMTFVPLRDWGTGSEAEVVVRNLTWRSLRNWTVYLVYPRGIAAVLGANFTATAGSNHRFDAPAAGWNSIILPRGEIRFRVLFRSGNRPDPSPRLIFRSAEIRPALRFNYAEALQMSLYFYEAQRSGKLPPDNRVAWRGDSALQDGADVGRDLSGGYYDAGDHVKFAFPMCASLTQLAWGGLEYRAGYEYARQWPQLLATIRWGADWLLKAHTAPNELYGQVGEGAADHEFWGPPEKMTMPRPSAKIDALHPGSDLAGEASAALAASSLLFREKDPDYAKKLLDHARQLFSFADQYRGKYSDAIRDARAFYASSGYEDELTWAAAWLYRATGEKNYLDRAVALYDQKIKNMLGASPNWDDKRFAVAVLLAELLKKDPYKHDCESYLDFWSNGYGSERVHYTPGGLAWYGSWGSLRFAANAAFLAFIYADRVNDYQNVYYLFGTRQIDYILGANPARRSYVVGFGQNPPRNPHHRASHGSPNGRIDFPAENAHTLFGALVGGPFGPDDFSFNDDRADLRTNEVALDYNAGFTGALARMVMACGGRPRASLP